MALLWGYNWVVMKIAMRFCGPLDFAALRGGLGVLLLFGVLLAMRVPLNRGTSRRPFGSVCSRRRVSSA